MRYLFFAALSAAALGLLSACGGSARDEMIATPAPTPPTVTQPMPDAFTAAVQTVVATAPDDVEPISIDATALTSVDDQEPVPVT